MPEDTGALPVGIALIGAGMIAQRHVTALSALHCKARLTAVVSRHPERARSLAQYYEGADPVFTSDLSVVLDDPRIRIVVVATPPSVRIELIGKLAGAGKHILLEKPVARNIQEAEQVMQICKGAGVKLGVLFQHRARATTQQARRLLGDGSLGVPGHVEVAVPLWRAQSYYDELGRGTYARDGGGVLVTQAIHSIDLMLSLLGPVRRVQAMTATTSLHKMEAEDFAVAGLRFKSGVVGSLVATTATFPHRRESISVHCSKGSMQLQSDTLRLSWHDGRVERYPVMVNADEPAQPTPKFVWHQRMIEDLIDAVRKNREPMASGVDALASQRLIDAIECSSRRGVSVDID